MASEQRRLALEPGDLVIYKVTHTRIISSLILFKIEDDGDLGSYYRTINLRKNSSEINYYTHFPDQNILGLQVGDTFSIYREGKLILEIEAK